MLLPSNERPRPAAKSLSAPPASRTTIDAEREALSSMLLSLRRNVRLIAGITIIGATLVTALVTVVITPQYSALATILVDSRKTQILKDQQEVVGPPSIENSAIDSEAEVLKSPALLRRVAQNLHLDQDDEFKDGKGVLSWVRWLLARLCVVPSAARKSRPIQ